jgi:hypothetical protein
MDHPDWGETRRANARPRFVVRPVSGNAIFADMNLSAAERALIEEMVAARSVEWPKPPWMPSHRVTRVKKEARRRIAALPPRPKSPTGRSPQRTYSAARRVTGTSVGKYAIYESDGVLPICALGRTSPQRTSPGSSWVPVR